MLTHPALTAAGLVALIALAFVGGLMLRSEAAVGRPATVLRCPVPHHHPVVGRKIVCTYTRG